MIGWSKNSKKNNPRKCFQQKKKKPALKFNPGQLLISLPTAGPWGVKPAFQFAGRLILKDKGDQSPVVQTFDRVIHWTLIIIQWISFKETICVIWWKAI